jgi:hypothetical protein
MFKPDSRYIKQPLYTATASDGRQVVAVVLPLPPLQGSVVGYHERRNGDRLDLLAARYLADATWFWKIMDANNALCADALNARPLVGIPKGANT